MVCIEILSKFKLRLRLFVHTILYWYVSQEIEIWLHLCSVLIIFLFAFLRSIVGMTMYNQATQEIAKPSELLTSVRAYMTVLQSIENYVQIDITRVFNNVLLQQTQHLDSHGEPTITSLYTNW